MDSFQGSEASVVLMSVARARMNHGFLKKKQRINVALTRAQDFLIIFMNMTELDRGRRKVGAKPKGAFEDELFHARAHRSQRESFDI